MKLIEITSITRQIEGGYFTFYVTFRMDVPAKFDDVKDKKKMAQSYNSRYDVETIDSVDYFIYKDTYPYLNDSLSDDIKLDLEDKYSKSKSDLDNFVLQDYDNLLGSSFDGTIWS